MIVLVIVCHPNPQSFTHFTANTIIQAVEKDGHQVVFHDLYGERFNPALTQEELLRRFSLDALIQQHSVDLERCGGIIIHYPDWWGQPPALLKGWLDRVLRPGFAYDFEGEDFGRKLQIPLLDGKKAAVITTSDSPSIGGKHPMEEIWRHYVFGYCGITETAFISLSNMRETTRGARTEWLLGAADQVCALLSGRDQAPV